MSRIESVYNCCLVGIIKYKDLIEKEMIMAVLVENKDIAFIVDHLMFGDLD